jgi:hypothetical protein
MRWTRLTLVITEAFVALSAFAAGAMFMVEPSGRLMGMSEATLARSPFRSYLVPGIVLFMVVGGTQALSAWAELRRWKSAGWLSVVAGAVLAWVDRGASGDDRARPPDAAELVRGGRCDRGAGVAATAKGVMAAAVRRHATDREDHPWPALRSSRPPDEVGSDLRVFR